MGGRTVSFQGRKVGGGTQECLKKGHHCVPMFSGGGGMGKSREFPADDTGLRKKVGEVSPELLLEIQEWRAKKLLAIALCGRFAERESPYSGVV